MATTRQEVISAAERERRRAAAQARLAREGAQAQAEQAGTAVAQQAREAMAATERRAQEAREEAERETAARQARIRKKRGGIEAEAQAVIAGARRARRIERRKADLPFSRPRDLGTASYIEAVDVARKRAHKAGESARDAVSKVRDDYFEQVDKWKAGALTDIDKQLKDIRADIAKSVVGAEADIAKQQADVLSGIGDWETKAIEEIRAFEATNVKLDTGEWVAADTYNMLPPDYQTMLKTLGVEGFNKKADAELTAFKAANIEVEPDMWVPKAEWGNLTPAQQKEVKATGRYTVILPPEEAFAQLKSEGKIPDNAILKSYDDKTGEITYVALKTDLGMDEIMRYWGELNAHQQRIQINAALGKPIADHYKDWGDLSKDERNAVLEFYTQSALPAQTGDRKFYEELWEEQKAQLKDIGIGMIPVYGTIYHWDRMSPTWRGISIALDVAIIIPIIKAMAGGIKASTLALKAKIAPIRTAASTLIKAESALADDMVKALKRAYTTPSKIPGIATVNRQIAKSYSTMIKAQGDYLKKLAAQAELTSKGRAVPAKLRTSVVGHETKLRLAARDFVDTLYKANSKLRGVKDIPVRFDSPEVRRLLNSLPAEMVQNSKTAISGLQLKPGNVKALARAVQRAETALKAAQAKYPTSPSKWVDLMYDLTKAQGRLAQAKAGSVQAIHNKLIKARTAGKAAQANRLQRELNEAIGSMEVEWGKLGSTTGGRVGVIEAKPLSPSYAPAAPPAIGTRVPVAQAAARAITLLIGADAETVKEWATPGAASTPEIVEAAKEVARALPKVKGVTTPEVVRLTEAALRESIKASLEGKTAQEIQTQTLNAVEPITEQWLETKPITQTQAKALTAAAVKTATKTAIELRTTHRYRVPVSPKKRAGPDEERKRYPDGTVAWCQGKLGGKWQYKIIPPPYNILKPITSTTPPRGMKRIRGTPQQTLTFIGDKVPFKNVAFDLGISDGFIDVKARKITFTGGGLATDVGTRLPSPTRGVALVRKAPGKMTVADVTLRRPGARRTSRGVYADRKGTRISRRPHRRWGRIY